MLIFHKNSYFCFTRLNLLFYNWKMLKQKFFRLEQACLLIRFLLNGIFWLPFDKKPTESDYVKLVNFNCFTCLQIFVLWFHLSGGGVTRSTIFLCNFFVHFSMPLQYVTTFASVFNASFLLTLDIFILIFSNIIFPKGNN